MRACCCTISLLNLRLTTRSSFLAGSLPLSLSLSQRQLRLLTAIGSGVLVGTALIIIIPEGVETLYSSVGHAELTTPQPPVRGGAAVANLHRIQGGVARADISSRQEEDVWTTYVRRREDTTVDTAPEEIKPPDEDEDEGVDVPPTTKPSHHKEPPEPHAYIGFALILGFSLMYLIDTLPSLNLSVFSSTRPMRPMHISLASLHLGRHDASTSPSASPALDPADLPIDQPHANGGNPPTTTLGLVIHALADGIALGASTASVSSDSTTKRSLGFIVFIALMLHKAPAAFGLTAVLLKQGLSTRSARAHLLVFSLAAPVGAFLTWISVNMLGSTHLLGQGVDSSGTDRGAWWTGMVLIFSGGTFLYVAMHSMQEGKKPGHVHGVNGHGSRSHGRHPSESDGHTNGFLGNPYAAPPPPADPFARGRQTASDEFGETMAVVGGMLLPLIVQMGKSSR
ncbi:MAG: ZIP family metal transporter [Terriglobus roseus]|nr:ZIP family metal transporter [Terriglobus roseus]